MKTAGGSFLNAVEVLVRQLIEVYLKNDRDSLQVAFGCHGGHHRSVYLAERFAKRLAGTEGGRDRGETHGETDLVKEAGEVKIVGKVIMNNGNET